MVYTLQCSSHLSRQYTKRYRHHPEFRNLEHMKNENRICTWHTSTIPPSFSDRQLLRSKNHKLHSCQLMTFHRFKFSLCHSLRFQSAWSWFLGFSVFLLFLGCRWIRISLNRPICIHILCCFLFDLCLIFLEDGSSTFTLFGFLFFEAFSSTNEIWSCPVEL